MAARPNPTARDMIVALAVLLLPVLVITWWFTRVPEPTVTRVDWAPLVAQARAESPYRVAVPTGLPDTWAPVRARWTPKGDPGIDGRPVPGNTWQLGFLTPDQRYLGLDQRDDDGADLISGVTRAGIRDGSSSVQGESWQRWASPDGRTRRTASITM